MERMRVNGTALTVLISALATILALAWSVGGENAVCAVLATVCAVGCAANESWEGTET